MIKQAEGKIFLTVGGHRLACRRAGQGPPILLLHGIPTNAYLWRAVSPQLVAAGFEVLAFDLLGYGDSDKPVDADIGITAEADLMIEALGQLDWRKGIFVGHDIGGGIVQLMAVKKPEAAAGLVLVDSILYDSFPEPGIARLKEPVWDQILGAPDFDLRKGLTKGFMRGTVRPDRVTPDLIDAYERPFRGVDGRLAYLRAARALRTEELNTRMGEVGRLKNPTLIVWGDSDVFQPADYGRRLAAAMPSAEFILVEQAGHFLPEDAPVELARIIGDFAVRRVPN